jgi:hypothetical protein
MTDMAANVLSVGRIYHSALGNDSRDELVIGHVECRIEYLYALGRQSFAENMRHLFAIALLDGNIFSGRTIDIDLRGRPGDVEGNGVALG